MSDDDDGNYGFGSYFGGLLGMFAGHSNEPKPTTNAGRYLAQLKGADQRFDSSQSAITEEMQVALRRIQITSGRAGEGVAA